MARYQFVVIACGLMLGGALGCASEDPTPAGTGATIGGPAQPATGTGSGAGSGAPSTGAPTGPQTSTPTPGNNPGAQPGTMTPPSNPGTTGTAGGAAPIAGAGAPMAGSAAPMAGASAPMQPSTPRTGETCLQPGSGSYGEPGPYKVKMTTVDLGMGSPICPMQTTSKFTIFAPDPLEASCPHPIVAWGNGTGVNSDSLDAYAFFSQNAASWGIVVIAAHDPNSGCGNYHKVGLDHLLKLNTDAASPFKGKLSTRAGVSGHSQGAFGASAGSSHPNVEATVAVGGTATASAKVSVLTLTGTEDIVMNPAQIAARAGGKAFVASWEGGDHFSTETVAGYLARDKGTLQMQRLYAAWFRCFLGDDSKACALFEGGAPDMCGMCKEPGWAVLASKNM